MLHFGSGCAILQYSTCDGGIDMKNIVGLEKHKFLYDSLTDFADKLEKSDSFTELEMRDLGMRLRYALEYITQQFSRAHELVWTSPFEIINTLLEKDLISDLDASDLHKVRKVANRMAHVGGPICPLELVKRAYNIMADYVPRFLELFPVPSEAPLLSVADVVSVEPAEEHNALPLLKMKCSSIPILYIDSSHLDYGELLGVDRFMQYGKSAAGEALMKDAPHNGNLLEWLYRSEKKENYSVQNNGRVTFVSRSYVADQYLGRVNKLIHTYNRDGVIGEPVYIPGIVQNYFGFSKVYFEGEELKYAPIEPAVILRDHALFCETVELPDCVTHIPNNDLLKQVNEFTLRTQSQTSVFSRVKHLVLPKGKWGDRVFLRYFPNLESVKIKEVGEIDPTPGTGAPEVFPAVIQNPTDQQSRNSLVTRLRYDPKFVAYVNDVVFVREELHVQKWGVDTVYVPKWVFDAQKRFGVDTELVYQAACLVKGVDPKPVRVGPASSMGGFRSFSNEAEKQALVAALMADPDFMDFVEANQITRKEIWVREGKTIGEPYLMWPGKGADYMNAHSEAVYEAGCRLKGLDPAPIVIEKPARGTVKAKPVCPARPKVPQKSQKSFITKPDGSRTFDCPEGKEALVQALIADPEFVAFVKVNRARPKRKLFESPYPWYQQGAQKFRAHIDAVYEAGLRIRGFSKGPQPQQPAPQEPPKPVKKAAAPAPKDAVQQTQNDGGKTDVKPQAASESENDMVKIGGHFVSQESLQKLFDFDAWN